MNDILRFLALAVAVGLAAGMVLGGIALALAAPAYATVERIPQCTPMAAEPPRNMPTPATRLWVAYRK